MIPFFIVWVLFQLPPTIMEVYTYYLRGGLVRWDKVEKTDQGYPGGTGVAFYIDMNVYWKRYVDRPTSEAAKAFYSYLDWSGESYDKSILIYRKNMAKANKEVGFWRQYVYGPFIFNWPTNRQWLRGDDAASMPAAWGVGGEARAREEWQAAKDKGFDKAYHYQIMRKIKRERAVAEAAAAAAIAK